jgi:GT2 family glycosyltransferase
MIMGAHCRYPRNYVGALVHSLETTSADNVGGLCRTLPGSDALIAHAIALALAHPFGVGNSYFRIGISHPKWVDTVPFGCYRRKVFDRIGLFDEELIRNQDDELNQRLLASGGRILLIPDVVSEYYARDSLKKVARMYYQYGYFKPLVARKLGRVGTFRQTVPAAFLLSLIATLFLSTVFFIARWAFAAILLLYGILLAIAIASSFKRAGVRVSLLLAPAFVTIHFSYGWGSLVGLVDFVVRQRPGPTNPRTVEVSR